MKSGKVFWRPIYLKSTYLLYVLSKVKQQTEGNVSAFNGIRLTDSRRAFTFSIFS